MTQQRLRYLFERYIRDTLSSEEKEELMGSDNKDIEKILQQLWQDSGAADAPVDIEGKRRIEKVMNLIGQTGESKPIKRIISYGWLKVAALLVLTVSVGLWLMRKPQKESQEVIATTKNNALKIRPGGNKAYLTMANGAVIVLNDVQNGKVATQSGIQIRKVENNLLVYDFKHATADLNAAAQFNTITTPRGGQYQVLLADGTRAWLNAASSIKFPVVFNGPERKVTITGEVYFEVAKNKAKPFIVNAQDVNVQVLGTHFNVSAYQDDEAVIATLMEGSVRMNKGSASTMLKPGQQGVALNHKANIKLESADIEATEAWRKGLFIFHEESIANVMKIMSRWYDVEIEYRDNIQDKEFGGSISKSSDISTLLENMKLTGAIHYKIEGRRVVVMK